MGFILLQIEGEEVVGVWFLVEIGEDNKLGTIYRGGNKTIEWESGVNVD